MSCLLAVCHFVTTYLDERLCKKGGRCLDFGLVPKLHTATGLLTNDNLKILHNMSLMVKEHSKSCSYL